MSFANPIFFWAFLSLIPLIAIYLLKVRPVRKQTTAFFLWNDIFREKKATSLFQRFRDLLSLLLMALVFASVVMALTRPEFGTDDRQDIILLVDNSASMNTSEGGTTRLESAKSVAREIVRALNGSQRCSIATLSNEATYQSHLTDNPKELLDAIDKINSTILPSRIKALAEFASVDSTTENGSNKPNDPPSSVENSLEEPDSDVLPPKHRVILITDGCVDGEIPSDIELLKIGSEKSKNVGLVQADLQRLPGGANRIGVFFQVYSTFDIPVEMELTLSHNQPENLIRLIPLTITPGINPPDVFELDNVEDGKWFMEIESVDATDSFLDDNHAYLTLPPKRPIPVAVAATDKYFFENSVLAFAQDAGLLRLVTESESDAKLLIRQGAAKLDDSAPNCMLVFQPQGESRWWTELGEEIEVVAPRVLNEDHPVLRHMDATTIPFVGARRLQAPPGSEILVAAEDDTPLIYRTSNAGKSAIVVNMDPLQSEFFLSTWFPVMVYSSATHLSGRQDSVPSTYRTGTFASIPGATGEITNVTLPDSSQLETQETRFGPLRQVGHYEMANSNQWLAGVSLLSQTESNVNNEQVTDNSQPIKRGLSLTSWLTILAILVVLGESVLYHRRKVG